MDMIAMAAKLSEAMRPRKIGKQVNAHVVRAVRAPEPDYEAMERVVSGDKRERASQPA